MSKQVSFKVSKRGGASTTCTWDMPESLEDPRWDGVVSKKDEDINELAVQNLIIKIQSGARDALEKKGPDAAQQYVNSYKFGARTGGGFTRPVVKAEQVKALKFSKAQLEALKAAGVNIEAEEETAA